MTCLPEHLGNPERLRHATGVKKHSVELYRGRLIMAQFKQVLNLKSRYYLRTIVLKKLVPRESKEDEHKEPTMSQALCSAFSFA